MDYFNENTKFLEQHNINVSSIKMIGESRDIDNTEQRLQEYTKQEYFNSEQRILAYIKQEYIDSEQRILEYIKNPPIVHIEEIKKEENPIKETSIIYELY